MVEFISFLTRKLSLSDKKSRFSEFQKVTQKEVEPSRFRLHTTAFDFGFDDFESIKETRTVETEAPIKNFQTRYFQE